MATWMETVTGWADKTLSAVIDKKVNNPHEIQKMQMQQYNDFGFMTGGMPGQMQQSGGINSGLLILGAGVLLVVLLVKD